MNARCRAMDSKTRQACKVAVRLFVLVALFSFYGCGPKDTSPEVGVMRVSAKAGDLALSAECSQWEDGCALILITDLDGPSMRGGDWRPTLALWTGDFSSGDGRKVDWDCQSPDGRTGTVRIDKANYDLAAGSLLLVTLRGGTVSVRQLDRDTLTMAPGSETIEALLSDPEVAAFFFENKE